MLSVNEILQQYKFEDMNCPHCCTSPFVPLLVKSEDKLRQYFDDINQNISKPLFNSDKDLDSDSCSKNITVVSKGYSHSNSYHSPLKIGDSFEDIKRKMVPMVPVPVSQQQQSQPPQFLSSSSEGANGSTISNHATTNNNNISNFPPYSISPFSPQTSYVREDEDLQANVNSNSNNHNDSTHICEANSSSEAVDSVRSDERCQDINNVMGASYGVEGGGADEGQSADNHLYHSNMTRVASPTPPSSRPSSRPSSGSINRRKITPLPLSLSPSPSVSLSVSLSPSQANTTGAHDRLSEDIVARGIGSYSGGRQSDTSITNFAKQFVSIIFDRSSTNTDTTKISGIAIMASSSRKPSRGDMLMDACDDNNKNNHHNDGSIIQNEIEKMLLTQVQHRDDVIPLEQE